MKGIKVFRWPRWTLQCYWPHVWCGGLGSFGIRASTGFIFSRYVDGGWAAGFELFGVGLGLSHDPQRPLCGNDAERDAEQTEKKPLKSTA